MLDSTLRSRNTVPSCQGKAAPARRRSGLTSSVTRNAICRVSFQVMRLVLKKNQHQKNKQTKNAERWGRTLPRKVLTCEPTAQERGWLPPPHGVQLRVSTEHDFKSWAPQTARRINPCKEGTWRDMHQGRKPAERLQDLLSQKNPRCWV